MGTLSDARLAFWGSTDAELTALELFKTQGKVAANTAFTGAGANVMDLISVQTAAGAKTFSASATLNGTINTVAGELKHTGTKTGFNGKLPIVKAASIANPAVPGLAYAQAKAESMRVFALAIRTALINVGLIT